MKRKTHKRDCPRDDVASVFQTHYLIIVKTYQRGDVSERDRQSDHFQNCYIFVTRRADCRASHAGSHVSLNDALVALVCGQSRDFCVCRRVPRRVANRARVRVFCTFTVSQTSRGTSRGQSRWCVSRERD